MDENDDVLKVAAAMAAELSNRLKVDKLVEQMPMLGPSLIILGMTISKMTGKTEEAYRCTVTAGINTGILPSPEAAVEGLREKLRSGGPEALARLLKSLMPHIEVQSARIPLERAKRQFPWG